MGWSCSACTYNNANLTLKACEMCGTARPVQAPAPAVAKVEAAGWPCHQCTFVNVSSATRCAICDTVRADDMMIIDDEKTPVSPSPVSRFNAIDLTGSPSPSPSIANGTASAQNVMKVPSEAEARKILAEAQAKEQERIQREQALKAKLKEQRMQELADRKEEVAREKRALAKKKEAERLESMKKLYEMEQRHQESLRLAREKRTQAEQSLGDIPSAIKYIHKHYGMESVKDVLSVLSKILWNIIQTPNELKFRTIKTSSPLFQSRIESRVGATAVMKLLGFQYQQSEDDSGNKNEVLFMPSPDIPFLQAEYDKMVALLDRT